MDIVAARSSRIQKVLNQMQNKSIEQFLITDPKSIYYLTGIDIDPMERFFAFLVRSNGNHLLFLNTLFSVPDAPFSAIRYCDTDPFLSMVSGEIQPLKTLGIDDNLPARFFIPLMEAHPDLHICLASTCVDTVRSCKDSMEQELMRTASFYNDQVMEHLAVYIKEGMSEREISDHIVKQFKSLGCSCSSEFIVSFGANAADAHHRPDRSLLQKGDCVMIDMGCEWKHYCSDMTRTFFCHHATSHQQEIYQLVLRANRLAEEMIRPGVSLSAVDAAARDLITQAGYGAYFNHRLGHFIGQTGHEKGDVSQTSPIIAQEGMIFSIEPGIYLPGEFGVRIEDLVLVTSDGCEILNQSDKNIRYV